MANLSRKIPITHLPKIRSFSNRLELLPQHQKNSTSFSNDLSEESGGQAIRYNVCREHGGNKKFVFEKKPKLPEEPVETEVQKASEQEFPRAQHPNRNRVAYKGYRAFDVSTTQKNIVLPLKLSKLASPFPEPVKVMPSHTVSDQDKAEQAQAEFRAPRSIARKGRM